jgi:hypothetical protein
MPTKAGIQSLKRLFTSTRSRVQRFRGSRLHSRPWTGFGMRIYKKSVSFVRPNPKFGVRLAIIWGMSILNEDFGPSLSLTLNVEP